MGTKLIVAEQMGRYDTVGIDCIAMNVNDVICVGADPIAVLDYVAVEQADPELLEAIGVGLKAGAEDAGVEIPGGELAVVPELIRGHPSPGGIDLVGMCVGLVDIAADRDRRPRVQPGDAIVGLPASGVHSNGFTLARKALTDLSETPPELGGASVGEALLEPTVIYVRAIRDLLASGLDVRGLAHITGDGLLQPAAPGGRGGLPDRLAAAGAADLRPDRRALVGTGAGRDAPGVQHGLRLLRRGAGRPGRRRGARCWPSAIRAPR